MPANTCRSHARMHVGSGSEFDFVYTGLRLHSVGHVRTRTEHGSVIRARARVYVPNVMGSGSGPGSKCRRSRSLRAGVNATTGHRGRLRSVLDMAIDGPKADLAAWLRALGATEKGGSISKALLSQWQWQGWRGDLRSRWWSTSRGSGPSWWESDDKWAGSQAWGKAVDKRSSASSSSDAPWRRGGR